MSAKISPMRPYGRDGKQRAQKAGAPHVFRQPLDDDGMPEGVIVDLCFLSAARRRREANRAIKLAANALISQTKEVIKALEAGKLVFRVRDDRDDRYDDPDSLYDCWGLFQEAKRLHDRHTRILAHCTAARRRAFVKAVRTAPDLAQSAPARRARDAFVQAMRDARAYDTARQQRIAAHRALAGPPVAPPASRADTSPVTPKAAPPRFLWPCKKPSSKGAR
jgi:hypothetical protein